MSERPFNSENPIEKAPGKIPTKEEILAVMGIDIENCVAPVKELADNDGIYFFEARFKGGENGEVIEYEYRRRGEFEGNRKSGGTGIFRTLYDKDGEFIKFPEHIAEYNHDTGEWENS